MSTVEDVFLSWNAYSCVCNSYLMVSLRHISCQLYTSRPCGRKNTFLFSGLLKGEYPDYICTWYLWKTNVRLRLLFNLFTYSRKWRVYLCLCLCLCLSVSLSVCLSVCLSPSHSLHIYIAYKPSVSKCVFQCLFFHLGTVKKKGS